MSYKSYEDIKFDIIEDIKKDPEEVLNLKAVKKEDLIGLHHTAGQWIRNNYKLWSPENPLTQGYETDESKHPDEVSFKLLTEVWEYFNEYKL